MKKERLAAFTDAVLAIIMTILVSELGESMCPMIKAMETWRENYQTNYSC